MTHRWLLPTNPEVYPPTLSRASFDMVHESDHVTGVVRTKWYPNSSQGKLGQRSLRGKSYRTPGTSGTRWLRHQLSTPGRLQTRSSPRDGGCRLCKLRLFSHLFVAYGE